MSLSYIPRNVMAAHSRESVVWGPWHMCRITLWRWNHGQPRQYCQVPHSLLAVRCHSGNTVAVDTLRSSRKFHAHGYHSCRQNQNMKRNRKQISDRFVQSPRDRQTGALGAGLPSSGCPLGLGEQSKAPRLAPSRPPLALTASGVAWEGVIGER